MSKSKTLAPTIQIVEHGEQLWITSLDVAEKFGKRHDNIICDIEKMECSHEFRLLNFEETTYRDSQGRSQPMFLMTRDGFSILAMGFTGRKAMHWKEQYIQAFNAMEKHILKLAGAERRRAELDWQASRQIVSEQRTEMTDALKALAEYARKHGSTSPEKVLYMSYSRMLNHALFELVTKTPPNSRDTLSIKQLKILAVAEGIVEQMVQEEIGKGTSYKGSDGIYDVIKARVTAYALTGRANTVADDAGYRADCNPLNPYTAACEHAAEYQCASITRESK